jgi:hypothetical protein
VYDLLECALPVGPELKVVFEFPNCFVLAAITITDEVTSSGDIEEGTVPVPVGW